MRILGVIPARCGSKGIKRKNIKSLGGRPLISYTIESALNSKLDRVVVSTDCEEIANISISYGAEVVMRPAYLATDNAPTLPVLQDVYKNLDIQYDALMTLQPTSPFRNDQHINKSIDVYSKEKKADSLVSVVEVPHNMSSKKIMSLKEGVLIGGCEVIRRQKIDKVYARNGAIYITNCNKLANYIFGGVVIPYIMDKVSSIDIDDMQDWELSELIVKRSDDG